LECGEHRRFAFGFWYCGIGMWRASPLWLVFGADKKQRKKAKTKGKAAMLAALQIGEK
jgi:hypothetical protein